MPAMRKLKNELESRLFQFNAGAKNWRVHLAKERQTMIAALCRRKFAHEFIKSTRQST